MLASDASADGTYTFNTEAFFPRKLYALITETRVARPEAILEEARVRARRPHLTVDGKLTILAADHPARLVLGSGGVPLAMADRFQYLGRVLRVAISPEFDGVMGTPDIIEDLLIVNRLCKEAGGQGFLDGKILIGCMNRGGLAGASFELDDRFTAYTAESIHRLRLDGAKLMFRLDLTSADAGSTVAECALAINDLNAFEIPIFLEALMVRQEGGKYHILKEADSLARAVSVASALGDSSRNLWLKIPYCERYEIVAGATTLPILMLGGESRGDPTGMLQEFVAGMAVGRNIRGALVGRNITFPGSEDPLAVALAVNSIVHRGSSVEEATDTLRATRGQAMDFFAHCAE